MEEQHYLLPDEGGSGWGEYEPKPPVDEFPDNYEIQQFENDYKSQMSAEELLIYNNMSRLEQLIYLWNAKTALDKAASLYPGLTYNDKGDAFKHAYFHALNTAKLDSELSKALGNAHENRPGTIELEKQMDLLNNEIGRNRALYLKQQYGSHYINVAILIDIQQQVDNGSLWYLHPLSENHQVIPGVTQLKKTNE